ncbi:hypothetical protein FisN_20Hh080 [Fistulifera solaris]|uniref:Uncharacterized protein n=1 Tax=Fistulifera solaris TaxID=1519565 RepID=A0A1Z5KC55_FISSO|nr:hypothetical protein FisN_20Hh080 [Fistulifera solaris]|eukprot:GAX23874.1 hypothetical protein FisN_20Hh080 [Fistulifera solaris]
MDSAPSTPGSSHENGGAKLYKTNKELLAYMSQAFNVNRGDDFEERGSDDSSLDLDDDDDLSVGSSSSFSVSSYATSVQDTKTMGDETRMLTEEGGLVKRSKVAIFIGIVALACTSALVTTYFVRKNETTTYHERFVSFSGDVSEKSQKALRQAFTATQQLSRTITDAIVSADNYFVAVPLFEIYGGEAKEAAQAEVIFWTPRIAEARLSDWESFAAENQQWILDGLVYENSTVNDPGSIPTTVHTRNGPHVHHAKDDIHIQGYHFPIWQMVGAPRNASIVNLDLMADSTRMEHDMIDATLLRQPLLSSIQDLQYLTVHAHDTPVNTSQEEWLEENNITIGLDKYYPQMYLEQMQQSYILQPIFATRDGYFFSNAGVASVTRSQTLQSDVVGFAVAVFRWDSLFADILPSGVSGMVVVVSDGCSTTLSYQINGKTVEYLGFGDLHDPMFEEEVVNITDFGSLADFSVVTHLHREINGTSYDERHAGTKKGHCQFTVQIYPSEEFVDVYNSDTQTLYIAVIVVIFVVVIFLLCMYDLMVIARQRKIIHIAKQTNTLISSLFPKAVQKRILEDAEKNEKLKLLSADEYDQVLGDDSKAKSVMEEHMKGQYQTKAIADYFPSATIFVSMN